MPITAEIRCRSRSHLGGALSLIVALILQAFCWGFTVDDAWIIARVAAHGAAEGHFSFNHPGPFTDAVTPFGFAHLLAGLGVLSGLTKATEMWWLARMLGLFAYALSFYVAGLGIVSERDGRGLGWAVALPALVVPSAAWAGAGMTAPLVGLALLLGAQRIDAKPRAAWGYLVLGLAPAWRPELMPACFAIAAISLRAAGARLNQETARSVLSFFAPLLFVAGMRLALFGAPLPLSSLAKAADPQSGMFYAAMTLIWAGVPWLLVAQKSSWRGSEPVAYVWLIHLLALVYAGGDWMPALRLTAPLIPWMVWVVGRRAEPRWPLLLAAVPAVAAPWTLLWEQGTDFRAVTERRLALVEAGVPALKAARVIAATDVGWVGLASDAHIVDLAGVTDPTIASLPGGHTSKAIYPGLFSDRDVDTWVIRAADRNYRLGDPLWTVVPVYAVDARLLGRSGDLGMVATALIPLEGTPGQYVVARRAAVALASPLD